MRLRDRAVVCVMVATLGLVAAPVVQAADSGTWRVGAGKGGTASASVFSTNTLDAGSTRAIDYHAVLSITCRPAGDPVWSQTVKVRSPVAGDGTVNLAVRLGEGEAVTEQWQLGPQKRSFYKDGGEAISRLTRVRRLSLGWRFGFLSGRGQADFAVDGVDAAVAKIAGMCGVALP